MPLVGFCYKNEPNNSNYKIQFVRSIKLLLVLAPVYHLQGVMEQRKMSPTCQSRYYTARIVMFKMLIF